MNPKLTLLTALAFAAATGTVVADDSLQPSRPAPPTRPTPLTPLTRPVPPTRALPDALKPYDANEDGRLSREEYKAYVDDQRPDTPKSQWDTDGDGTLSETEIEAARTAMREKLEERFLARFNEADTDGSGALDEGEFKATLPGDVSAERAAAAFDRLDANDDDQIGEDEFLRFSGLPPRPDAPRPPKLRPDTSKPRPPVIPPLPGHLQAIDLDGNGILSRAEILQAMEDGKWPPRPTPPTDGGDDDADDGSEDEENAPL